MEPRGCDPWQSAANRPGPETAKTSEIRCHRLPPVARDVHGKQGVCRGLPPVAGCPLPAKEGVDAYLARLCAPISSCSPGTGTGRSRGRCMPCGSWRDDSHGFQPRSVCGSFQKRGSARRGRAGTARFRDADVRRRFVEVEVAAAFGPNPQAKEVERADEPRSAITSAGRCAAKRHFVAVSASASVR